MSSMCCLFPFYLYVSVFFGLSTALAPHRVCSVVTLFLPAVVVREIRDMR